MIKRTLLLAPLFSLFSCLGDDSGFDYAAGQFELLFTAMLSEYNQQDETLYSFTYKGWNLKTMTYHRSFGDFEYTFEYDDRRLPVKASATRFERLFEYYFYYENGLLKIIEEQVDGIVYEEVSFTYDDMQRIVFSESVSNDGSKFREYTWEEYNISRIESYSSSLGKEYAKVFEFEYDDRDHPLKTAFHFIGYNLIDDLPIIQNNWISMSSYWKSYPSFVDSYEKDFEYYDNGFPFKETIKFRDDFGYLREIETNYVY